MNRKARRVLKFNGDNNYLVTYRYIDDGDLLFPAQSIRLYIRRAASCFRLMFISGHDCPPVYSFSRHATCLVART